MIAQFRSEVLKLRSIRTVPALLLTLAGLVLFVLLVHGITQSRSVLASAEEQKNLLAMGSLGALFAAYVGVLSVTGEFRHGTIRPTLLASPRRGRMIGAKLALALETGATCGLVSGLLALAGLAVALDVRGVGLVLDAGDVSRLVLGTVAMGALWGPLGVAIGALVRNQVAAIVGLSAWVLLVENLLIETTRNVARFLPVGAGEAISGGEPGMLGAPAGSLLLVAYVVTLAAGALIATARRDVA